MEFGSAEEIEAWRPECEDEPYASDYDEYEGSDQDEGSSKGGKGNYINGYYHEIYQADKPAKQEDVPVRDWNEEFQSILHHLSNCNGSEEEKLQLYNQLSNLAHDFVYVAKTYGKIIILERCLPPARKTIKPVDIGGTAGGEKYICQGILFKFAVDSNGLYGGDEYSQKAAGHELKGLMGYYQCQIEGLHHPLMTLIDYRGFRLTAMSILPLFYEGIVYGSNDGGQIVHEDDACMSDKMEQAARKMNLKGHMAGIGPQKKLIYGPTDIEGHQGTDGRYYVLDYARVYPPEAMAEGAPKASYLYNLLRPELVKRNPVPLSSDAYSRFGGHDKDIHDTEVLKATQRLHKTIIPSFAAWLDSQDERKLKGLRLTQLMHREGINMRHLGSLRMHVTKPHVKSLLLNEMMSRGIKCTLQMLMRKKMEQIRVPSEEPYRRLVIDYFNVLLGKRPESAMYWRTEIKKTLNRKFASGLTPTESSIEYDLKNDISMPFLFGRVQNLMGIKLAPKALHQLATNHKSLELVYPDLVKMSAKMKHMDIISHAEGAALCIQSKKMKGEEGDRLFELAMCKFDSALSSTPDNQMTLKNWGDALALQMQRKAGEERQKLVYQAVDKYQQMRCNDSLMSLGDQLYKLAISETAEERDRLYALGALSFKAATELNSNVWQAYYSWGNLLYDQATTKVGDEAQALYEAAGLKYAMALQLNPNIHTTAYALKRSEVKKHHIATKTTKALFVEPEGEEEVTSSKFFPVKKTRTPPSSPTNLRRGLEPLSVPSTPTPGSTSMSTKMTPSPSTPSPSTFYPSPNNSGASPPSPNSPYTPAPSVSSSMVSPFKSPPHSPLRPLPTLDSLALESSPTNNGTTEPIALMLPAPNSHSLALEGAELTSLIRISQHCSSFETVDSAWTNHCITDRVVSTIMLNYPSQIKTLKLPGCHNITNAAFLCHPSLPPGVSPTRRKEKRDEFPYEGVVFPSLEHVDVSETEVTDDFLNQAPNICPSLKNLDLHNCNGITNKARIRAPLFSLQQLNLSECSKVGDEFIASIASHCPSLKSLSLAHCSNITNNSLIAIASHCPLIENLDLSTCKVEDEALVRLAASCSHLRSIKLTNCKSITEKAIISLAKSCPALQVCMFGGCEKLVDSAILEIANNCPHLHTLDLTRCKEISNNAIIRIANKCPHLQSLSLEECKSISDEAIIAVSRQCPSLHTLRLGGLYKITDASIIAVAQNCSAKVLTLNLSACEKITNTAIIAVATHCPSLRVLNLTNCTNISSEAITSIARNCHSLMKLNLFRCRQIKTEAVVAIAQHCPELQQLVLAWCPRPSVSAIQQIAQGCPSLKVLDLLECKQITDEALISIAHQCPSLEVLNLTNVCKITDLSLVHIAQYCCLLRALILCGCYKVTDTAMIKVARHCPRLQVIRLGKCYKITDISVMKLAHHCPELQMVSLNGCKQITDTSVLQLTRSCAQLKHLGLDSCNLVTRNTMMEVKKLRPKLDVKKKF